MVLFSILYPSLDNPLQESFLNGSISKSASRSPPFCSLYTEAWNPSAPILVFADVKSDDKVVIH